MHLVQAATVNNAGRKFQLPVAPLYYFSLISIRIVSETTQNKAEEVTTILEVHITVPLSCKSTVYSVLYELVFLTGKENTFSGHEVNLLFSDSIHMHRV